MSLTVFSQEKQMIKAEAGSGYKLLDLVSSVNSIYSSTSEIYAKVISLQGEDGVNPTHMALSLNPGSIDEAKIYILDHIRMRDVRRVTFLAKDVIIINYDQNNLDGADGNPILVRKSIKISIHRDKAGQLADKITTEDFSN